MRRLNREAKLGYLYFLPAIIVFVSFVGYPFFYTVYLSFRDYNWFTQKNNFIGFANYEKLFCDVSFWTAFLRTIVFSVGVLIGQVIISFVLANIITHNYAGVNVFRSFFILPWILPTVVTALAWRMMLHERWGVIPYVIQALGFTTERMTFLANTDLALPSVICVSIWRGFPLMMVSFIAALQSIPREMYEAAIIDGANAFRQMISITIPYLKKMVTVIILFRTIWVFNDFDLTWLMTRGGPASSTETLPIYVYQRSFGSYKFGEAASIAMFVFIVLALFSSLYFHLIKDED